MWLKSMNIFRLHRRVWKVWTDHKSAFILSARECEYENDFGKGDFTVTSVLQSLLFSQYEQVLKYSLHSV